jgi:hypothetical protein
MEEALTQVGSAPISAGQLLVPLVLRLEHEDKMPIQLRDRRAAKPRTEAIRGQASTAREMVQRTSADATVRAQHRYRAPLALDL